MKYEPRPFSISILPPSRALRTAEMKSGRQQISIETERLLLRPYTHDDFIDFYDMVADPETFCYSDRGAMTGEEAWTRLLRHVGHWALFGYGLMAVEEKATGRFVGEAGLGDFRRQFGPQFDPFPEASWTVASWARGRGYATEAAAAALNWMESRFDTGRTVCLIHVDNAPSIAIARKLGYVAFREREYRGYRAFLFGRARGAGG